MPKFTTDWFTNNIRFWNLFLNKYKAKEKIFALEIGSYEGRSTLWMLDNILTHPSSKIYCIDSFTQANVKQTFLSNIKNHKSKVTLEQDYSFNALVRLNKHREVFDIVYIDGDHTAKGVLEDAVLSFPLLKKDGIMIFDDYQWGGKMHPTRRPEIAIDSFIKVYANKIKVLYVGYQVFLQKKG